MHTRSIIALVASLVIVASSVAMFAHSMRAPAYDITLAPSVIDGLPVDNMAPIVVTPDRKPVHRSPALQRQLSDSVSPRKMPPALGGLQQVMPYYSFAHALTSFDKD